MSEWKNERTLCKTRQWQRLSRRPQQQHHEVIRCCRTIGLSCVRQLLLQVPRALLWLGRGIGSTSSLRQERKGRRYLLWRPSAGPIRVPIRRPTGGKSAPRREGSWVNDHNRPSFRDQQSNSASKTPIVHVPSTSGYTQSTHPDQRECPLRLLQSLIAAHRCAARPTLAHRRVFSPIVLTPFFIVKHHENPADQSLVT